MAAKKGKRKLIVTGQKPITNIKLNNGGTTTLYEVFATTPEGGYVEEPLRAFQELDVGQCLDYEIEVYNHPRYGTSYTLTPPKKETARRLREMEERLAAVIHWAEGQGFNLQRELKPDPPFKPKAGDGAEAEAAKRDQEQRLDERFGTEAPWTDEDLDQPPAAPEEDSPPEVSL